MNNTHTLYAPLRKRSRKVHQNRDRVKNLNQAQHGHEPKVLLLLTGVKLHAHAAHTHTTFAQKHAATASGCTMCACSTLHAPA
jgi:hypothetical protein